MVCDFSSLNLPLAGEGARHPRPTGDVPHAYRAQNVTPIHGQARDRQAKTTTYVEAIYEVDQKSVQLGLRSGGSRRAGSSETLS